jgi:hypothetical protein
MILLANSAMDEISACYAQPASAGFRISASGFNLGVGIRQQYPKMGRIRSAPRS